MENRPFPHPFVKEFDLPTVERDGGTGAVMADGASYREIMDTADWDRSVVTNVPGQSGQPESEFYGNLLPLWDKGEYFPMVYSRAKVDQNTSHKLNLRPGAGNPGPFRCIRGPHVNLRIDNQPPRPRLCNNGPHVLRRERKAASNGCSQKSAA